MSDLFILDRSSAPASLTGGLRRFIKSTAILVLCVALVASIGCSSSAPKLPPPAPRIVGYIVGAPDVLSVHILPDPEISREVRVRPDGMISIDLVGDVQAAGRTPLEIAADIQTQIGRFKRGAVVNVTVVDSPSQFVTVYGEVRAPGTFPLNAELRVSEAIGQMGGPMPFASLNKVRVIRNLREGPEVLMIRLGDIQKGDLSTNEVVEAGDLIVVPPTALARVGYAMQMLLFPLQPLISGAAQGGAIYSGYDSTR